MDDENLTKDKEGIANFFTQFDFSAIQELDPSVTDGHKIIFDREFPMEWRTQEGENSPPEISSLEPARCKILIQGEAHAPDHIRMELTTENNLFFHYVHALTPETFAKVQKRQNLRSTYKDYSEILMKMITSCIKEPHSFVAIFITTRAGTGRLDFVQDLGYKFVELLSLEFLALSEVAMQQHITYRYNALKSKLAAMHARLQDVNVLLTRKNPALLLHLQKAKAAAAVFP